MALRMWPVPGKEKSRLICAAFATGAPKGAVGSVFFGTEGVMSAFQKAKACGEPWWYCDNSYFDKHRGIYFRVTKNALQVDPRAKTSDGKRFAALQVPVRPMRCTHVFHDHQLCQKCGAPETDAGEGRITLLAPQSDDFMKSTLGLRINWALEATEKTLAWLESGSAPFSLRVHPWQRDKTKRNETFAARLPDARLVISYSSAASITALLEGVPAISTGDSAAAHWIGGPFTRGNVLDPVRPSIEERTAFAQVLADNQFTLDEFRSGKAWSWLNR